MKWIKMIFLSGALLMAACGSQTPTSEITLSSQANTFRKKESTFESGRTTDQALCRKDFPSHEQMIEELQQMTMAHPFGRSGVGGLAIKNENPLLIKAYRYLVSYKNYRFGIQNDVDLWHIFKDSTCDKSLCAAQAVFGAKKGTLYLYVAVKYGLVLSDLGFDRLKSPSEKDQMEFDAYFKVRPWNMEELKPYLKALPLLPESLLPLPFTRMNHAGIINPVNANVLSNGIIQFYSSIDSLTESQKEQTTYHELGHNFGSNLGLDTSKEWFEASHWTVVDKRFVNARPDEFITRYAASSFFEDFAESFTYYRYYPKVLKAKSPTRYDFMKTKVFANQEFLDSESCSRP